MGSLKFGLWLIVLGVAVIGASFFGMDITNWVSEMLSAMTAPTLPAPVTP